MRRTCLIALGLLGLLGLVAPASLHAQDPSAFAWEYVDADLVSGGGRVTRFELQIDGGAWTDLGIPTGSPAFVLGSKTYRTPVPALPGGDHTAGIRACDVDLCSTALTLTFPVPVAPTNFRAFTFDYADADLGQVTRFELQLDGGLWVDLGIPTTTTPITGGKTYQVPVPALTPGTHTAALRACNVDLCSIALTLTFEWGEPPPPPPPAPTNFRITGASTASTTTTAASTWYWPQGLNDTGFPSGPTTPDWQPHNFIYGAPIPVAVGGRATKLAVRSNALSGTPTLKLGLYTASGTFIAQGTVLNGPTTTWREATIDATIAAGTYIVTVSSSDTNSRYFYTSAGNGIGETFTYAASMPATISTTTDEPNTLFAVKVFVETP